MTWPADGSLYYRMDIILPYVSPTLHLQVRLGFSQIVYCLTIL